MRILIVYFNYPQLSATYVEAEIRYFQRQGIEVEVWSECDPGAAYPPSCFVHRGTLPEAEAAFKPDIVHFYWVKMALKYLDRISCLNVTIRDHSFGLSNEDKLYLLAETRVRAVFLFPHEMGLSESEKFIALPVAYDSDRFPVDNSSVKQSDLVVCCTAGLPKKNLETFIRTSVLCPNHRFVLAVATCTGHLDTVQHCVDLNRRLGSPVDLRVNVAHDETASLMRTAGVYLCTQDLQKRGMPIAVAEALASGCYTLVPELPWLCAMIGNHGHAYANASEAAESINETSNWSTEKWELLSESAARYSLNQFSDEKILPKVIHEWNAITSGLY